MNTIPRKLGRYVIIREIGRGAMGVVYKAHDPVIEREVAIKAIQIAFDVSTEEKSVFLSRFFREAKAAGKLSHPNIVTIFDVDEDPDTGTPFIVMEFLEGTTISEVTASGTILPLEDINTTILQLADALNYAHSEGVVHRDIKAANILVLPGMTVKIMDFGIARLPHSDLTQSGQFIGTPNYMSPEQIEGKTQVDGRSDLFSLGVIFYMLLTAERPFAGDSFNTVSYRIVHADPVPPRQLNAQVPAVYNAIISKLLAKDPADRYQTGADLVKDLKHLMANMDAIEQLNESSIDSTSPIRPSIAKQDPRAAASVSEAVANSRTITVFGTANPKRLASLGLMILMVVGMTLGAIYFMRESSQQKKENIVRTDTSAKQPDQVAEMSRQNAIRIKWDLAMKYVENDFHDQAIKELNDILRLDPRNDSAKKFLDLMIEKKAQEGKKKSEPPPPPPVVVAKAPPVKPVHEPAPAVVETPVEPVVKMGSVEFEFEHGFPSGIFYIFSNEKLAFEGNLSSEKKKVFIFKNYKGKLTGSFQLPAGETSLLVHIVCREKGISASKKINVSVHENGQHNLRIRYLKSPKKLELSWT